MRKLTASLFMSLDGVVDSPQDWHFPYMNEEMMGVVEATKRSTDALLLGRVTYQEWAGFWPDQPSDGGMADFINGTPKFVASTTLGSVNWENSTILTGDVADAVADLKGQPGKDIAINGSGTLVRSLLAAGLVDELQLLVHPIVVGRGKHLFEEGEEDIGLELAGSETFGTGVLNLTYKPAAAQRAAAEAKGVPA